MFKIHFILLLPEIMIQKKQAHDKFFRQNCINNLKHCRDITQAKTHAFAFVW